MCQCLYLLNIYDFGDIHIDYHYLGLEVSFLTVDCIVVMNRCIYIGRLSLNLVLSKVRERTF